MTKMKISGMAILCAAGIALADGTDFDRSVSSVKYVASYSGGPAQGMYLYLSNGSGYRYLFNASGNSVEHGRGLMAVLLSAQASGRNVNIDYTIADPDGSGSELGTIYAVTVR